MVFVKVRETYDLKTVKNKMTVIGIHTPKSDIIKRNYPGLLMQCKAYRPYSCDVKIACASVLPLDPLGVGTTSDAVAPEDVFNPILYKAMSNKGMSQLETRIKCLGTMSTYASQVDVDGQSAIVDVDSFTPYADEFNIYYGLLSNTHEWKHANPQAGLEMCGLRPLVYDVVATQGDMMYGAQSGPYVLQPEIDENGESVLNSPGTPFFLGRAKDMPFIPCTAYSYRKENGQVVEGTVQSPGFGPSSNGSTVVPEVRIMCGCVIIPPSKLHELFFRMVIEWTIEFSALRPLSDISAISDVAGLGTQTHFQNYSYSAAKQAITGESDSILDQSDACMVSSNVDLNKVM